MPESKVHKPCKCACAQLWHVHSLQLEAVSFCSLLAVSLTDSVRPLSGCLFRDNLRLALSSGFGLIQAGQEGDLRKPTSCKMRRIRAKVFLCQFVDGSEPGDELLALGPLGAAGPRRPSKIMRQEYRQVFELCTTACRIPCRGRVSKAKEAFAPAFTASFGRL